MSNKSQFPNEFLINNIPISDKSEIAQSFNIFFANIGARTSHISYQLYGTKLIKSDTLTRGLLSVK